MHSELQDLLQQRLDVIADAPAGSALDAVPADARKLWLGSWLLSFAAVAARERVLPSGSPVSAAVEAVCSFKFDGAAPGQLNASGPLRDMSTLLATLRGDAGSPDVDAARALAALPAAWVPALRGDGTLRGSAAAAVLPLLPLDLVLRFFDEGQAVAALHNAVVWRYGGWSDGALRDPRYDHRRRVGGRRPISLPLAGLDGGYPRGAGGSVMGDDGSDRGDGATDRDRPRQAGAVLHDDGDHH
jgi:hypothetical protein